MLMVGPGEADGATTEAEGAAGDPDGTEAGSNPHSPTRSVGAADEPQPFDGTAVAVAGPQPLAKSTTATTAAHEAS
jgi:hypothetical protein